MLSINNLSFYYGSRIIFEEASLHIKPKDKIGLIGLNGKGKSTLLKLIIGDLQADKGEIAKPKDCLVGFLNQDLLSYQTNDSILSVAMEAFERENYLQKQIDEVIKEMEVAYEDKLLEKLTAHQEEFDQLGGYTIQARTEEILEGLGFNTADLERPLKEFSGGWRMRVMLAKMLLAKPSLLMLDEPTNHLDLPTIEWVENYLRNYDGAIIVVSHDRYFLDNVCTSIAEVAQNTITTYSGNYSFYLEEKEQRDIIQKNSFKNQQQQIKQTEKFIERFKAKATKAKQVQSRVKALDRMDMVEDVVDETPNMNIKFKVTKPSGKIVLELKDFAKSYDELQLFKNSNAVIKRGDKIALIGANGKGKSTLLRIISGNENIQGERIEGYNVFTSFYAQHQLESLDLESNILQELVMMGTEKTEQEIRNVLGAFLFSDEEVQKKIKVLSGGEKSRVALAKTMISEANFLLLDEPTNHLDIISVGILSEALKSYEGTFVTVSHDRHFIKNVANKIWYIEDKQLKEYPGTYDEYQQWMSTRKPIEDNNKKTTPQKKKEQPVDYQQQKEQKQKLNKLQSELEKLEKKIEQLEKEKAKIEKEMALPSVYTNPDLLAEKNSDLEKTGSKIDSIQEEWDELAIKIDTLENE